MSCSRCSGSHALEREHLFSKRPSMALGYQALKAKSWQLESHTDIADLHRKMSERAPYRANRLAALLSKMLALAIR